MSSGRSTSVTWRTSRLASAIGTAPRPIRPWGTLRSRSLAARPSGDSRAPRVADPILPETGFLNIHAGLQPSPAISAAHTTAAIRSPLRLADQVAGNDVDLPGRGQRSALP